MGVVAIFLLLFLGLLTGMRTIVATDAGTPPELFFPSPIFNSGNIFYGPHVNKIVLTVMSALAQEVALFNDEIDQMGALLSPRTLGCLSCISFHSIVRERIDLGFSWLGFNYHVWSDPSVSNAADISNLTSYKAFRVAIDYSIPRINIVASQLGGNGYATCEAATDAWGIWMNSSLGCRPTGTTNTANRTAAVASLSSLVGTVFTNKTSGCTEVMTSWCFANVTSGNQIRMNLYVPNYDSVKLYAAEQISNNMRAVGFDLATVAITLADLSDRLQNYHFNLLISGYSFSSPRPDWLYDTFHSSQDLCRGSPDTFGCVPNSGNGWGLHDSELDNYLQTIKTDFNLSKIQAADANALAKLYNDAEFLVIYTRVTSSGANIFNYHGYFNRLGQGIQSPASVLFSWPLMHRTDLDFNYTAIHPSDSPVRPFTFGITFDISISRRWEFANQWGVMVNQAIERAGLNYLDPMNYSLQPFVAAVPSTHEGTLANATVDGQPGLIVKYRLNPVSNFNRPAFLANNQLVRIEDYEATLDYAKAEKVPSFYPLLDVLSSYQLTDELKADGTPGTDGVMDTLVMRLNSTGYWRLYDTNLEPTYCRYWGGPDHDCSTVGDNVHYNFEPTGQAQLDMLGNSTTGPFKVTSHVPGVSLVLERNMAYWRSIADTDGGGVSDFLELVRDHTNPLVPTDDNYTPPVSTPVFIPIFNLAILATLPAVPAAIFFYNKKSPRRYQ